MAAAIGNKYAVGGSGRKWRDAIRKALAQDKQSLEAAAVKLIECATNGDLAVIKELGDRLDGKALQNVTAAQPLSCAQDAASAVQRLTRYLTIA